MKRVRFFVNDIRRRRDDLMSGVFENHFKKYRKERFQGRVEFKKSLDPKFEL